IVNPGSANKGTPPIVTLDPTSPAFGVGNLVPLNDLVSGGQFPADASGRSIDQYGNPRIDPARGKLDLGAFEFQAQNVSQSPTFTTVTPVSVTYDVNDQVVTVSAQVSTLSAAVNQGSVSFAIFDPNENLVAQAAAPVQVGSGGTFTASIDLPAGLPVLA